MQSYIFDLRRLSSICLKQVLLANARYLHQVAGHQAGSQSGTCQAGARGTASAAAGHRAPRASAGNRIGWNQFGAGIRLEAPSRKSQTAHRPQAKLTDMLVTVTAEKSEHKCKKGEDFQSSL